MRDNETSGVKLEMYMDSSNINNWTKVSDITDRGWYTKSNNTEFFSAGCDRARDHVIIDGGPTSFLEQTYLIGFQESECKIQLPPQLSANTNSNTVFRLE